MPAAVSGRVAGAIFSVFSAITGKVPAAVRIKLKREIVGS
jgi:hypothetical protein